MASTYHAIVIDVDNNVIVRGLFQAIEDSNVVIVVDNVPINISYKDINLLKFTGYRSY
jgi:hypothetical protein